MKTLCTPILIVLMSAIAAGCSTTRVVDLPPADHRLSQMSWLAGAWVTQAGEDVRVEEHWTQGAGGTMLGLNRTVRNGETVAYEFLRIAIEPDGSIVYHASPGGRDPATPFALVRGRDDLVVFENLAHDFPRRIIYRRTAGGWLDVRVEGVQDGVAATAAWRLRPASVLRP